jgi:hypothetical protein
MELMELVGYTWRSCAPCLRPYPLVRRLVARRAYVYRYRGAPTRRRSPAVAHRVLHHFQKGTVMLAALVIPAMDVQNEDSGL